MLLYKIGRFLQLVGMLILPVGVAGNLADPDHVTVKMSLLVAGAGMIVFCVGWLIQQYGHPQ